MILNNLLSMKIYQKPYKSPVMTRENPSLCYKKEETRERDELYRQLRKWNKKLKKEIKDYKVLNHIIK